jgi:hypothetical protein
MGYIPTGRLLPFCSYCGRPPKGPWLERSHRVCRRCKLGIVLHTPADASRLVDQPFLIVDRVLTVQAVSRAAQAALRVNEADAVGVPLDEFIVAGGAERRDADLSTLATLAIEQALGSARVDVCTVEDPELRFTARVSVCGPPAAALLTLTAVAGDDPARPLDGEQRDAQTNRVRAPAAASAAGYEGARAEHLRRRARARATSGAQSTP